MPVPVFSYALRTPFEVMKAGAETFQNLKLSASRGSPKAWCSGLFPGAGDWALGSSLVTLKA